MTARGIRNKNPGNIEKGDEWKGLAAVQDDPRFCVFRAMMWGCRALIKTLRTYHEKHGLRTVREIINRWAPSHENDTGAYVWDVSDRLGVGPDDPLPLEAQPRLYIELARAIAYHENGQDALECISPVTWESALEEAFK